MGDLSWNNSWGSAAQFLSCPGRLSKRTNSINGEVLLHTAKPNQTNPISHANQLISCKFCSLLVIDAKETFS